MLPAVRPFAKGEAEPRQFVTPSNEITIQKKKKDKKEKTGEKVADVAQASAYHGTPVNAVNEKPSL